MGLVCEGKLAVISGGSMGLGLGLATLMASNGASIVLVARREAKLQEAVAHITSAVTLREGQTVRYVVGDASKPEDCERVFGQCLDGAVPDIVLCSAGHSRPGLYVEMTGQDLIDCNNGVYMTCALFAQAGLKHMSKASSDGQKRHLSLVSSVLSDFPMIGYGSYAPAKAAIRALADVLRQEHAHQGIDVSLIVPGNMDTEGYAEENKTKPEVTRQIEGSSPTIAADLAAERVFKQLRAGHLMCYTDTTGWVLSSLRLGASPRHWAPLQVLIAIFMDLFAPVLMLFIMSDIRKYYRQRSKTD